MKPDGGSGRSGLNSVSQLLTMPVCAGSGELVGHVEDMLMNPGTGKVEYLAVNPRLSSGTVCVRLTWKDVRVDTPSERFVLVPGSTAVKRLLLKTELSEAAAEPKPLH